MRLGYRPTRHWHSGRLASPLASAARAPAAQRLAAASHTSARRRFTSHRNASCDALAGSAVACGPRPPPSRPTRAAFRTRIQVSLGWGTHTTTLHRGTGYGNLASLFVCYGVGSTAKLCTRPTSTELNVTVAENCGHSLKEPNNSGLEITRHLLQGSAAPRGTGMWASGGSSMAHSPILIAVVPGGGRTRIMGPWAASKHQKCDDHHNCTAGDF